MPEESKCICKAILLQFIEILSMAEMNNEEKIEINLISLRSSTISFRIVRPVRIVRIIVFYLN